MTYYTSADLASAFRTVRKNTLLIAHDIPAEKYAYRATPDTRTVCETLAHVASNTRWVHKLHGIDKATEMSRETFGPYIGEANAFAATLTTKEAVVAALEHEGHA